MLQTLLDLISVLVWPLAVSAAAWGIVIKALAEADETSGIVQGLTEPRGPKAGTTGERLPPCRANVAVGERPRLHHFARTRPAAFNLSAASRVPIKQMALSSGDCKGGDVITASMGDPELQNISPPAHAPKVVTGASLRSALLAMFIAQLVIGAAPRAHAARFEIDQRRTEVRFEYTMAYSRQRGRFTKVSGTLDYEEAEPEKAKIRASIAAASLTTGEALVDNELKGSSFFNVERSPVITFKSLSVRAHSPTAADVAGEITINGITKPVALKVSIKPHDDPALKHDAGARAFVATTRIKRSAFNMTDYQSIVDDDIDLEINVIARPK